MKIALIGDAFPPLRSSGAVQLRDLAKELAATGHCVTAITPSSDINSSWTKDSLGNVEVIRLKSPRTKDMPNVRRAIAESLLPFSMLHSARSSPIAKSKWDGIIWYSPTIFLGLFVASLKRRSQCPAYLIVRDIFPEWAVDTGLLRRGPAYRYFKTIERYQYSVADVIGVQTPSAVEYFSVAGSNSHRNVEVLHNWLSVPEPMVSTPAPGTEKLQGRFTFVYAGNMGAAQGMALVAELAVSLSGDPRIGFLFVGRGSEAGMFRELANSHANIEFLDEIDPSQIPELLSKCHAGIVSLDRRHTTHNIPGKFLTYMQAEIPVLAAVNPGNDIIEIVRQHDVGRTCVSHELDDLRRVAMELFYDSNKRNTYRINCRALSRSMFNATTAAQQIVRAIQNSADRERSALSCPR